MDLIKKLSYELNIEEKYIAATVELLDNGATIPFISRYRKEVTNGMEDVNVRKLFERLTYIRNIEARKKTILESIESQGKLTDELRSEIEKCEINSNLEDIYRPFKPKRQTRGSIAVKKGLKPLAEFLKTDKTNTLKDEAKKYISEEKGVKTIDDAINGAKDIIAEEISDNPNYRTFLKNLINKKGFLSSNLVKNPTSDVYNDYDNYKELISKIRPHRILATSRGEKEKCLTREVLVSEDEVYAHLKIFAKTVNTPYQTIFDDIIKDSYIRLIKPSVDNDVLSDLFTKAEDSSIETFKINLRELLMVAPLKGQVIMGFDPGYINGCKIAVIDSKGDVLATSIVYPTIKGKSTISKDEQVISDLIKKFNVTYIALGNGTASRESEEFLHRILKNYPSCELVIVSEAGASIYSASELAIKEFPKFDVSLRSAVSIARRLLDPLSELVKIDPRSIGVGQYQHDMNQTKLKDALGGIVEDCVNAVGVDINVASPSLLSYVSGINAALANEIVLYRSTNGMFKNRKDFSKVKKFGPKAFENAAGFLRIKNGEEPLDNTGIHPESYKIAKELIKELNITDISKCAEQLSVLDESSKEKNAEKLNCGILTLNDIILELSKPNRDPRDSVIKAQLNNDVKSIKDLKIGMVLEGTVRNIMDFGCFVDIGIHEDGLVHISELSSSYVKNVSDIVKISDIVKVEVISIDEKRNRIGLSMKRVTDKKGD